MRQNICFSSHDFKSMPSFKIIQCGGEYKTLERESHFIISFGQKIKKGWYLIDLATTQTSTLEPHIVVDLQAKFFDAHEVPLTYLGNNRYQVYIFLPAVSDCLRLFPHSSRVVFNIERLDITPLSVAGSRNFLTMWLSKCLPGSNKSFLSFVPDEETGALPLDPGHIAYFDAATKRLVCLRSSYYRWRKKHDFRPSHRKRYKRELRKLSHHPLVSILMPFHDPAPDPDALEETITSIHRQIYPNWELCIVNDHSRNAEINRKLKDWSERDTRIKVTTLKKPSHIAKVINTAFAMAQGEFIALMDHDGLLSEHALAEMAVFINRHPGARIIYSDEDKIDINGQRYDPYFKCDWSPDLFRSQNYLKNLTLLRRSDVREAGGWREGFEGSQDYDLLLRLIERIAPDSIHHIPKILYHMRAARFSAAANVNNGRNACHAGKKALEEHIERTGINAVVEMTFPYYHMVYSVGDSPPLVSLIIPTKNQKTLLAACIDSILRKTSYPNYEILVVDNGSSEQDALDYLKEISSHKRIRVLEDPRPYNFSALNNRAVTQASGQIIALVNNDVEVISFDWLSLMVGHAMRPEIGCVGAKLYFSNDLVQHAGVILGLGGVAGHGHKYFRRSHHGYFSRLILTQNLSAITGACLVVRKEIYQDVGGLNEKYLAIAFNDIDFCLKVREKGYRNIFEPNSELYHHESISRGPEDTPEKRRRFRSEVEYMKRRWGDILYSDPYYSPNLSLQTSFLIKN